MYPFKLSIIALVFILASCGNSQTDAIKTNLSATEFAAKINELADAPIVDVRTPDEFSKGHLVNALNYDWNGSSFDKQTATLDKSQPVFVYCLSGGRSADAASKMRKDGFKEVYELDGGIMSWRSNNFAETTAETAVAKGMSKAQYEALLEGDKLVLVDFYADWCAPCKKMKPYLEEISKEMADEVVVVRINIDDHAALSQELKIEGIPVLKIYKNKKLTWDNMGYVEKEEVLKHLK